MPITYPPLEGTPRADLANFLRYVQRLLDELTAETDPTGGGPTFVRARLIAPLADYARDAWQDARPVFAMLADRIMRPDEVFDSTLDDHGLRGPASLQIGGGPVL